MEEEYEILIENAWCDGQRQAWRYVLMAAARQIGFDDPLAEAAALFAEREDARTALRDLAKQLGIPDDWPDDLHLADVIEKRIGRHF